MTDDLERLRTAERMVDWNVDEHVRRCSSGSAIPNSSFREAAAQWAVIAMAYRTRVGLYAEAPSSE